jgi:hypothetical protein
MEIFGTNPVSPLFWGEMNGGNKSGSYMYKLIDDTGQVFRGKLIFNIQK